jgi:hypothetical protein
MNTPRISVLLASVAIAMSASVATAAGGAVTDLTPVEQWQADPTTIFDAKGIDLDAFRWIARPLVVFADSSADPAFKEQMGLLEARIDELVVRDVIVITDTSRTDLSDARRKLRPRGFMLTLIGKDGGVKLRKPLPWDVRELSRSIDKMPMRRQELRDAPE